MSKEEKEAQQAGTPNPEEDEEKKRQQIKRRAQNIADPITGMTGQEMAVGYWWVSHKLLLRKLGLSLLLALCVILVGYSIYGWGTYLAYGIWKEGDMVAQMAEQPIPFSAYHKAHAPQAIVEEDLFVLDSGTKEGWKDIIVPVYNPNSQWMATMTYHFEDELEITPDEIMTVLPGEETVIGVLGYAPTSTIKSPQFVKTDVSWQRINPHNIPDPPAHIAQRRDFPVSEIQITRPGEIEDLDTHKIIFDITNNTIHSYWSVPMWVMLYRNNKLVGVEQVVLEPFELGETQTVDVRSLIKSKSITNIEVISQVNIFDEGVYKPITDDLVDQ